MNSRNSARIVHLTSVHAYRDPRIFLKECRSAASHGFDTHLIAPDVDKESDFGVTLHKTWNPSSRFLRITVVVIWTLIKALRLRADIYHFHDPELLGVGFMLSWMGYPVIYDVHEDYETSIRLKTYLPSWVKTVLINIYNGIEKQFAKSNPIILAERYYEERLPSGVKILNYPTESVIKQKLGKERPEYRNKLLYTGNITKDRGAFLHASLVNLNTEIEVYMVGRCPPSLADQMYEVAGSNRERLHIYGEGFHVPFDVIEDYYARDDWLAGLAIFPEVGHYVKTEPTKFFEYMGSGVPVLCSSFPTWKALISNCNAGLTVDPSNQESIKNALEWMLENPDECAELGENGRAEVKKKYTWRSQEEKLIDMYKSVLD